MGPEKLDNTVYFIRGLYDLADMAAAKPTGRPSAGRATWPTGSAPLRSAVVGRGEQTVRGLAEREQRRIQQKHWIGVTPMEVELTDDGETVPGLAPADHGAEALAERETPCFSGEPPYNRGLFHTGCGGGPTASASG